MATKVKIITSSTVKLTQLLQQPRKDSVEISSTLSALTASLESLWNDAELPPYVQDRAAWSSFTRLVTSGRIMSIAAQSQQVLHSTFSESLLWVTDLDQCARWAAQGIYRLAELSNCFNAAVMLLSGAASGVYKDPLPEHLVRSFVIPHDDGSTLKQLITAATSNDRHKLLSSLLNWLVNRHFKISLPVTNVDDSIANRRVKAAAYCLDLYLDAADSTSESQLADWAIKAHSTHPLLRRAIIASLPQARRQQLLVTVLNSFTDSLYIKHAPSGQQDELLQLLLLCLGYEHRTSPSSLSNVIRASNHMTAISSRLASSSPTVRFHGMLVGTAVSRLLDTSDKVLKFDFGDDEAKANAERYLSMPTINDTIGNVNDLRWLLDSDNKKAASPVKLQKPTDITHRPIKKPIISVVDDSDEDDLEPLPIRAPNQKSINGNNTQDTVSRPIKPIVYIRDLLDALKDTDNAERFQLAMKTGPALVRQKAKFGTEVRDQLGELSRVYIGLQDPFEDDEEEFHNQRGQALLAVVLANVAISGPIMITSLFHDDLSMQQRASILTALGTGAATMVGMIDDKIVSTQFASQRLPNYIENRFLVEKLTQAPLDDAKPRTRQLRGSASTAITTHVFRPLLDAFSVAYDTRSSATSKELLPLHIKTLSIVFTAAGASATMQQDTVQEYWALLLHLRQAATGVPIVAEALLLGFLSILTGPLDKRRIVQDYSRALLETQSWASALFEATDEGDEEGGKVKVLSAKLLTEIEHIVKEHHRLMAGELMSHVR